MAIEYSDGSDAKTRFNQMPMESSYYSEDSQHQSRFPAATQQQYRSCRIDTEKFVIFHKKIILLFIVTTLQQHQSCITGTEKFVIL